MTSRLSIDRLSGSTPGVGTNANLPDLHRPQPAVDVAAALDEINALRLETSKMDVECRQIRSKTARMKQIIRDRNFVIKKALTLTDDRDQNIKTASETTLSQLRGNIITLQNTLESRREELDELKACDRLAVSDELKVEVLEYFCELDRLRQQADAVREGDGVITGEMSRLRQQMTQTKATEKKIPEVQAQVDQLVEKLIAYRLGQERIESNAAVEHLLHNPHLFLVKKKNLEKDLRDLAEAHAAVEADLKQINEDDQHHRRYLQSVIDDQAEKITQALEVQHQEIRERRQSSPRKSPKGTPKK
jgi:hypothetical protein